MFCDGTPKMKDLLQNRKDSRFLAGIKASVGFETKPVACQAVDLHRQGVLVEGEFDKQTRSEATIHLESTAGDLTLETRGKVAHVSENPETGKTRLGIEFGSLAKDQQETLERLLSRVIEGTHPAAFAQLDRNASEAEIRDALSKVSLAHKITLAQRAQLLERRFLMHDDVPLVIEAICRNPQLTEPEVVNVLRRNDILPTTLELLSRDSRWTSSEEFRIAIATHRHVTFLVAERMVKNLSLVAIRKVLRNPGLNPAIKAKIVQSIPGKRLQGW